MVVTTTNSAHKLKDTELEIKNKSPAFKLRLGQSPSVFITVQSWQHAQAQTPHKKGRHPAAEYAALQLSPGGHVLSSQDDMLLQKILQHCSSSCDCTWPPRTVQPLSGPSQHEDPPHTTPSHDHIFVVTKPVRPQPLYLFCYCRERLVHRQHRSLIWIQMFHNVLDQIHDTVE